MGKSLTIGVDIRSLRIAKTGTKTYLEELCREFKKIASDEVYFHFLDNNLPVYTGPNKVFKMLEHFKHQLWKQLLLPLKAYFKSCDIVFCTDDCVPFIHLGYKTIPVFHDAFCFEAPENYGRLWLWLYLKTAVPAAKSSPFVITPTQWSKKQIHHFTHISNDKLIVINEGPKTLSDDGDTDGELLLSKYDLTANNYILHVGSIFKRKNIPNLILAFGLLKNTGYPTLKLVLAGSASSNAFESDYQSILDAIKNTNLQREIVLTGYLNDSELGLLYKNASIYVFPSVNEGFGIPILEAFKYNLPVLVANNTCLPEVGGDAVLKFDPLDPNDIFLKIKMVLDDESLQKQMISRGNERLKQFSWQSTALQIVEVFKKATNRF
jgi:glycosyltransferase involved in cell wall biosynthesis